MTWTLKMPPSCACRKTWLSWSRVLQLQPVSVSESTNFSEVMAAQGYYQGVRTACDALVYTMQNVLQKAESPADASAKVSTILSSFGTYVGALTKGLPVAAFKADLSVSEVVKSAKDKAKSKPADSVPEGADEKEWAKMSDEKQKAEWKDKAKAKKDEADAAAAAAAAKTEGEQGKAGDKPAGESEQASAAAATEPAAKLRNRMKVAEGAVDPTVCAFRGRQGCGGRGWQNCREARKVGRTVCRNCSEG